MSAQPNGLVGYAAGFVRCVATEAAAVFFRLSATAHCVEDAANSGQRSDAEVHGTGVSPPLDELREGAANVVTAVLIKARSRELTDNTELEKALQAASVLVDAIAEYVSALARAEHREALEGKHS